MGNCNLRSEDEGNSVSSKYQYYWLIFLTDFVSFRTALNKNLFDYKYAIGRGGFGKVWRVISNRLKGEKITQFAMKEMLKARVVAKRSVHSVINEKKFLSQLYHPFLVNMNYAFDDRENLYLVIDLMTGGDLRYHLAKHKRFSEK